MLFLTCRLSTNIFPYRLFSQTCILPYKIGRFNAAEVRLQDWPNDIKIIRETLEISIEKWKKEKHLSAWLWIPIEKAHVIPIAADLGFNYHNAEDKTAVLCQWLLPTKSLIPRFATHQVGVGSAVLHPKTNELLIIKERVHNQEFWKIPGGAAELSENIGDSAVREVFEETGIQTKFESVIGFRQTHHFPGGHGRSDLYFVCRLSALTDKINMDKNEVLDCRWIKLEDAIRNENALLQRIAKQILFGLHNGFEESIDFLNERILSIVTGLTYDYFTRSLKINK